MAAVEPVAPFRVRWDEVVAPGGISLGQGGREEVSEGEPVAPFRVRVSNVSVNL